MTRCKPIFKTMLLFLSLSFSISSHSQEQSPTGAIDKKNTKTGKDYISLGLALNEFRSIKLVTVANVTTDPTTGEINEATRVSNQFPITAQTYGMSAAYGTYITDHFKTEVRYGTGIRSDTLDETLEININYWFNWYMGATHPVTDYMSAYALYGVSFYDADVTRKQVLRSVTIDGRTSNQIIQPSVLEMEEDLFGTSFSTSWILGLDFALVDNWFLAFEYGRLIRDTDTSIKVYQAGAYLRYEF